MLAVPQRPLSRGDEGPEVEALHGYLRQLGYAVHGSRRADLYDEALAEALRRYQRFFGLEADGDLGEATLDQMRKPRCGVADLMPGPEAVPRAVPTVRAWPRTDLSYGFIRFTKDLTEPEISAAVLQAFDTWAAVTPLSFRHEPPPPTLQPLLQALALLPPPFAVQLRIQKRIVPRLARVYPADILVGFLIGEHGDPSLIGTPPFDNNPQVAGHGFPPPGGFTDVFAGDVHFNDAVAWIIDEGSPRDLVSVAIHEIGHGLGLAHTEEPDSVMFPTSQGLRALSEGDIQAIQSLYGPP